MKNQLLTIVEVVLKGALKILRTFIICAVIVFAVWSVYKREEPDSNRWAENDNSPWLTIDADQGETMPEAEAVRRWQRSISMLEAEKVPYNRHQPLIETVELSRRRTSEEVAHRAMALCAVALKREMSAEEMQRFVERHQIADWFTPEEKEYIENPSPAENDTIQFSWRYECYWVMLWAMGYVDKLERPEKECDVDYAVSILVDNGAGQFIQKAALRSQSELLDAADLIYRYHWAVRDASIKGKEAPAGLNADVVMERHHALNWLIGYGDADWDDVTTDT